MAGDQACLFFFQELAVGDMMNNIDALLKKNREYWMSDKTTYLGAPDFAEKAKSGLLRVLADHIHGPNLTAVDVGCGNGDNTALLASYFQHIDGYELSPERVRQAGIINPLPNGSYKILDVEKDILPASSESIDAIFFLGVSSAVHSDGALTTLFESFHRALKPGGLLVTRDSLSPRYTYRRPTASGYFAIYRSLTAFLRLFHHAGFQLEETYPLVKQEKLFNSIYVFTKANPQYDSTSY